MVDQKVKNHLQCRQLGSIPGLGKSPGEGNGNALQYSCLDNSIDRGAWWATQSMGSQRVRHDWVTTFSFLSFVDIYILFIFTTAVQLLSCSILKVKTIILNPSLIHTASLGSVSGYVFWSYDWATFPCFFICLIIFGWDLGICKNCRLSQSFWTGFIRGKTFTNQPG